MVPLGGIYNIATERLERIKRKESKNDGTSFASVPLYSAGVCLGLTTGAGTGNGGGTTRPSSRESTPVTGGTSTKGG